MSGICFGQSLDGWATGTGSRGVTREPTNGEDGDPGLSFWTGLRKGPRNGRSRSTRGPVRFGRWCKPASIPVMAEGPTT